MTDIHVVNIRVVTEGATEREVGRILHDRGILSDRAKPQPPKWESVLKGGREGFSQVIEALKSQLIPALRASGVQERLLLVFDQEDAATPQHRATLIGQELGIEFNRYQPQRYANLFECIEPNLHVMLHVSDASVPGINRGDFDGYILRLLQGQNKISIANHLARSDASAVNHLLTKAEQEIPELMQRNGFRLTHAKSWLYAYITVFQFRQSHVGFARKIVTSADDDELKQVFASLIAAWDALI